MKPVSKKVAVVLSGGGAKGAYEAGALKTIVQKAGSIQIMTGASIGAINAAVFAWEYEQTGDLLQAAKKVQKTWLGLGGLFKISFLRILSQAFLSYLKTCSPLSFSSLVDQRQITATLKGLIPQDLRISDLKRLELAINATSLTEGRTVTFHKENDTYLYEAVLASSSIPLLLEAQKIKGHFYVDGGVFNNTPLRDALKAQATDIFVVQLKPKSKELYFQTIPDPKAFSGVYAVAARLVELITDKIMYEDLKQAKRVNEIIQIIHALEAAGGQEKLIRRLQESIGYKKNGKTKRYVNFYEIAPSQRLDPPGTMGFDQQRAIKQIMKLGEQDAAQQLAHLPSPQKQRVS